MPSLGRLNIKSPDFRDYQTDSFANNSQPSPFVCNRYMIKYVFIRSCRISTIIAVNSAAERLSDTALVQRGR
jgi:hypothetical protein